MQQLIGYERNHAERIQVLDLDLDLLEHRRDQLRRHALAAVPNE